MRRHVRGFDASCWFYGISCWENNLLPLGSVVSVSSSRPWYLLWEERVEGFTATSFSC